MLHPKVVSDFHVSQLIIHHLPFHHPLQMLNVACILWTFTELLPSMCLVQPHIDSPLDSLCVSLHKTMAVLFLQELSRWIVSTNSLAYELGWTLLPSQPRPHSTRAMSTSTAFLQGIPLPDICRAATWTTPFTFATHYRLDVRACADSAFCHTVLSSTLL